MADEWLYSDAGDLRLSEVLAAEYQLTLADRFSLIGYPAIHYAGNLAGRGSSTIKVPLLGLSRRMSGVAENASVANTAVSDSSVTITVARQALQSSISDFNAMVDSVGANIQALYDEGVNAYVMRWMELFANCLDDFSTTASPGSGSALTFTNFLAAQFSLIQNSVPGPYVCVLYGKQFTDLITSIRSETGPVERRLDSQSIFEAAGVGFHDSLNGVDLITSSLVPSANAGADSAGAMFGQRAIAFADGTPAPFRGNSEVVYGAGQKLWTEFERDASGALTKIVHNAALGFSELEDLRGVTIISDR